MKDTGTPKHSLFNSLAGMFSMGGNTMVTPQSTLA